MTRKNQAQGATLLAALLAMGWLAGAGPARAARPEGPDWSSAPMLRAESVAAGFHDISPPLSLMRPVEFSRERREHKVKELALPVAPRDGVDPVVQRFAPRPPVPADIHSFDGIGEEFVGPAGEFIVNSAPPDTNGDVGPNHYVQAVNVAFAVFDKSGQITYGPVPINTLWSGFAQGAPENECEVQNDGDAVVLYDSMADRWFITQFAVSNPNPNYYQCVAISVTGDPTGAYYRYAFPYTRFNDYGKFGIWPDAYYATYNMFSATQALGSMLCAFDRAKMLRGEPATQQCSPTLGANYTGVLPVDFDGKQLPPASSPGYFLGLSNNNSSLLLWKFKPDWNGTRGTLTGPVPLPIAPFTLPTRIHQPGTEQRLNLLNDRMMFRFAYRNFGTHESLVANHTVGSGLLSGVRWYELRDPNGSPTIHQQGTFAPADGSYRWMASVAMDQMGNIGLGYSVSGDTVFPGLAVTGRLVGDELGQMTQGENVLIAGSGSQQNELERWGDYSSLSVDPSDECTFWYTSEYIAANGAFNWHTRIGKFRFSNCPPNEFGVSAPGAITVPPGGTATAAINTTLVRGTAESLTFSAEGLPPGVRPSFDPATVTAGGSTTLTLSADATGAVTTNAAFRVVARSTSVTHTADGRVTVPGNDFAIALEPAYPAITEGKSAQVTVKTQAFGDTAEPLTLALGALPAGITGQLSTTSLTAGQTATLTLAVAAGTPASRPVPLVVTATSPSTSHPARGTIASIELPTAFMSNPESGANVTNTVALRARASISPGANLDRFDYYVDDVLVGTVRNLRDAFLWDSTRTRNGAHSVFAKVFDSAGNEATTARITVNLTNALKPPTVKLSGAEEGAQVKGELTLTAEAAASSLSTLAQVEFFVDDTSLGTSATSPATLTWDSKSVSDGAHVLKARARDSDGISAESLVNVTVKNSACGCGAAGGGSSLLGLLLGMAALARRRGAARRA
jgi:hypothetical protein